MPRTALPTLTGCRLRAEARGSFLSRHRERGAGHPERCPYTGQRRPASFTPILTFPRQGGRDRRAPRPPRQPSPAAACGSFLSRHATPRALACACARLRRASGFPLCVGMTGQGVEVPASAGTTGAWAPTRDAPTPGSAATPTEGPHPSPLPQERGWDTPRDASATLSMTIRRRSASPRACCPRALDSRFVRE